MIMEETIKEDIIQEDIKKDDMKKEERSFFEQTILEVSVQLFKLPYLGFVLAIFFNLLYIIFWYYQANIFSLIIFFFTFILIAICLQKKISNS